MRSYTVWQCLALSFWALWKTESYLLLLFDSIISPSSLTQLQFCGRFQAKLAKFLGNQFKFVFAFPWVSVTCWVCEPSRSCVNWWVGNTITRVGRLLVKKNLLVGDDSFFLSRVCVCGGEVGTRSVDCWIFIKVRQSGLVKEGIRKINLEVEVEENRRWLFALHYCIPENKKYTLFRTLIWHICKSH